MSTAFAEYMLWSLEKYNSRMRLVHISRERSQYLNIFPYNETMFYVETG